MAVASPFFQMVKMLELIETGYNYDMLTCTIIQHAKLQF